MTDSSLQAFEKAIAVVTRLLFISAACPLFVFWGLQTWRTWLMIAFALYLALFFGYGIKSRSAARLGFSNICVNRLGALMVSMKLVGSLMLVLALWQAIWFDAASKASLSSDPRYAAASAIYGEFTNLLIAYAVLTVLFFGICVAVLVQRRHGQMELNKDAAGSA